MTTLTATTPVFNPQPYKISTITATGSIGVKEINLDSFYKLIVIVKMEDNKEGFAYIEYGKKKGETFCKGFHKKMTITRRKRREGKRFDNQATVILRLRRGDILDGANIKVFSNGNVQMTGIKTPEQGLIAIEYLITAIREMNTKAQERGLDLVVANEDDMKPSDYRIRLINSDFRVGFFIKRDVATKIIQNKYGVICGFEPCIYPGVKVQYCCNTEAKINDGICRCEGDCNGKGNGTGDGQCKRITAAIFQSGCIIITGAQSLAQIDETYKFICMVIDEHLSLIRKPELTLQMDEEYAPIVKPAKKKKVYVLKSNIRIPEGYILEAS